MTKIDKAVELTIDRIAMAQQNIKAMSLINNRLSYGIHARGRLSRISAAQDAYWAVLQEELADAWGALTWFAPINKQALDLLYERSRSMFTQKDVALMHFLGYEGSYYTSDKEEFERELLEAFGIAKDENK